MGTGLSGATVADSESIGRGSKRSIVGKRRAGSTASSKRSQQQRPATSEKTAHPPSAAAPQHREGSMKSKSKRKEGGLLSCLPCFSSKDVSDEEETPQNVKAAAKVNPSRTSQPTPMKKTDPNAVESSTADSKEPLDEKLSDPYDGVREKPAHGDGATDRKPSSEAPPAIVTRSPSTKKMSTDQPLPPLPSQSGHLETAVPQIGIQGPTPGTTPVQSRPSTEGEQIILDQTPEQHQRDADLEMRDVPISTNDVQMEEPDAADQSQKPAPTIDLPPPPPLQQRKEEVQTQQAVEHEVVSPTRALLPALKPAFKGKKCLVLDLDETLVHSSFKVRKWCAAAMIETNMLRYFNQPTLRFPWRSRANTTMCMLSSGQVWMLS
jgi:RNA polymerase II subunit A small phosphatase-like protein